MIDELTQYIAFKLEVLRDFGIPDYNGDAYAVLSKCKTEMEIDRKTRAMIMSTLEKGERKMEEHHCMIY